MIWALNLVGGLAITLWVGWGAVLTGVSLLLALGMESGTSRAVPPGDQPLRPGTASQRLTSALDRELAPRSLQPDHPASGELRQRFERRPSSREEMAEGKQHGQAGSVERVEARP